MLQSMRHIWMILGTSYLTITTGLIIQMKLMSKFHANPLPYWPNAKFVVLTANYELCHILTPEFAKNGALSYGLILCKDGYLPSNADELDYKAILYDEMPEGYKLCTVCKERLQDMIGYAFEPGSPEAVEYGCICKMKNVPWQLDRHVQRCPLYKKPKASLFRAATTHWK